jgi:hypothetical protein
MTKTGDSRNEPLVACTNGRSGLKTLCETRSGEAETGRNGAIFDSPILWVPNSLSERLAAEEKRYV